MLESQAEGTSLVTQRVGQPCIVSVLPSVSVELGLPLMGGRLFVDVCEFLGTNVTYEFRRGDKSRSGD